jgi:2-keto-4-pentenoate hydratase
MVDPQSLTARLLEARRSGTAFAVAPEDVPQTEAAAYAVQHAVAATLGPIGGWKVGAGGPDAKPTAAPLPASVIVAAPARLPPTYSDRLVEAEIAFRIACDLPPRDADSLGHGGLVVGEAAPGWQTIDFAALQVTQEIAGQASKRGAGNPAGDMIRLIAWLADEGAVWAGGLKAGQIVTCGSWSGMTEAAAEAPVVVTFAGLTPVALTFHAL